MPTIESWLPIDKDYEVPILSLIGKQVFITIELPFGVKRFMVLAHFSGKDIKNRFMFKNLSTGEYHYTPEVIAIRPIPEYYKGPNPFN